MHVSGLLLDPGFIYQALFFHSGFMLSFIWLVVFIWIYSSPLDLLVAPLLRVR